MINVDLSLEELKAEELRKNQGYKKIHFLKALTKIPKLLLFCDSCFRDLFFLSSHRTASNKPM